MVTYEVVSDIHAEIYKYNFYEQISLLEKLSNKFKIFNGLPLNIELFKINEYYYIHTSKHYLHYSTHTIDTATTPTTVVNIIQRKLLNKISPEQSNKIVHVIKNYHF